LGPLAVVNAGDGTHEHRPGAARRFHDAPPPRRPRGRRITIVGDVLHSRVARSNALLLATLGAEVTLVAPPTLLPVGVDTWPVQTSYDLDGALDKCDAVMMLRVQRERMNAASSRALGSTADGTVSTSGASRGCPSTRSSCILAR
jgi:aspartate carbamoyltransferase catalytic subunit